MVRFELRQTSQFKKDVKRLFKRNRKAFDLTIEVLEILKLKGHQGIPIRMKPHKLQGSLKNNWECHIKPDLLIIWIQFESPRIIKLVRLGSHADLFG